MDILFIVPYVPNLIRVRPYNLIRSLSARGHKLTVMTLWSNDEERESLQPLSENCEQLHAVHIQTWRSLWNCLRALPAGEPLQSVYSWEPALAGRIQRLALDSMGKTSYDVVHVEHLRGARYGLAVKSFLAGRGSRIPIVWDSVDSISLLFRQAMVRSQSSLSRGITRLELGRTEKYEAWLAGQFDRILVTSPADRNNFLALRPENEGKDLVEVLPNGVDLAYFCPDPRIKREASTIVISGKMSYHANVTMVLSFIREIMPYVWSMRRDVRVSIVGKDPPRKIKALTLNPNVSVTGTVEDIRPYLQSATLSVSPITYGAGIQNKVLEAMACGTPVIATPKAVSALKVKPGRDLMVADEPVEFARTILALLDDEEKRRKLGLAGRAFVEKNHDWDVIAARLEKVYCDVILPDSHRNGAKAKRYRTEKELRAGEDRK